MINKKTAIGLTLFCASIFIMVNHAFAGKNEQVYTSVTTGKQVVVEHNTPQARKDAESRALAVALQNAYSSLVPNQVFASNLVFFYNQILPKTMDYVIAYKVLGAIENAKHYIVGVESKIDLKLLKKTLSNANIFNTNKDKPVILFFISEQTPADNDPKYWWQPKPEPYNSLAEQIIIAHMTSEQFMIIGNTAQRPDPSFYNIVFNSVYDKTAAIELGKQLKADMIIIGDAITQEAINRMGEERTFNATINLSGYNLETGEKAITSRIEAVVKSLSDEEGTSNALAKAAGLTAQDLINKINEYWIKNLRKEHSFAVKIQGENFHPRYIALSKRFKQMPGIENIQPNEIGSSHVIIDMFYKGDASQFANALMLKTFDDFGFEFLEVSDQFVSIQLIEKTPKPLPEDILQTSEPLNQNKVLEE